MPRRLWTARPLAEDLPALLAERGLSLRSLAREVGVNQSYLSRILGAKESRPASKQIAAAIATALDLPVDYFPEYRLGYIVDVVSSDAAARDRIYDALIGRTKKRGH